MSERRSLLGDLSWLQILVGALAAMTSAWIASTLGVGGTIIGAAVGSLVIPISSALYGRGLDKGRVLVVRTDRGDMIEQRVDDTTLDDTPGDDTPRDDTPRSDTEIIDQAVDARPDVHDAAIVDRSRRLRWRPILLTSVAVLVLAIAAMGAVEVVTDQPYGSNSDNSRIGSTFTGGGGGSGGSETDQPDAPAPTGDAPDPDDPVPDEPTPTTTPAPTQTPPTGAPTPAEPAPSPEPPALVE